MRNIKALLKEGALELAAFERGHKEAAILLAHVLKCDKLYLMTHEQEAVPSQAMDDFFAYIARRKMGEPIEYIVQSVSFYSQTFYVDNRVLIARPETELLIDEVLACIDETSTQHVVEVGTGSGIISIMLAHLRKNIRITALDISPDALEVARLNAMRHHVDERIVFVQSDLLEAVDESIDVVVSNPPYIQDNTPLEKPLFFEPNIALFGGKQGDELLHKLLKQAIDKGARTIACEMGYDQRKSIAQFMLQYADYVTQFYKDYSQHDRGFVTRKRV